MIDYIFHITSKESWSSAKNTGAYVADSLTKDGFIHCSKRNQVMRVANEVFTKRHGLVLLMIDPFHLTAGVRWEKGTDQPKELFPHIYGPLNLDAVVKVFDFEPGAEGKFILPIEID
jgi:uncharacterized protein (DUF952 family)